MAKQQPKQYDEDEWELDTTEGEGADYAHENAPAQVARRYPRFLNMKEGDPALFFRPCTDLYRDPNLPRELQLPALVTVQQHAMVPTKPKPADHEGPWKAARGCVCRADKLVAKRFPQGCWVCDNAKKKSTGEKMTTSAKTWGVACRQVEVIDESGQRVGFQDAYKTVYKVDENGDVLVDAKGEPTGETEQVRDYYIFNQAYNNFFGVMEEQAQDNTIVDRVWRFERLGLYEYLITPQDPDIVPHPDDPEKLVVLDLRDPAIRQYFYPDIPSVARAIKAQVEDAYFDRYFIPQASDRGDSAQPAAASSEPQSAHLKALQERMRAMTGGDKGKTAKAEPVGAAD